MADLWEVISDPHRRELIQLLAEGEKSVSLLAAHFPVSRSAISQHLLLLVEVGLVTARKEGRNRYYCLHEDGAVRLQKMFDAFWRNELDLLVTEAQRVRDNKGEN
jgi:DNA-binding transcriptional ArsR family regulator